jgi:hypothetical protein
MKDDIFDTTEKQQNAIALFNDMKNHPGWILFVKVLQANIAILSRRLEVEEFESIDKMKAVQRTRQAYEDALNTPDMIIEAYSRDNSENNPGVDPYQSIEEFRLTLRKQRKA